MNAKQLNGSLKVQGFVGVMAAIAVLVALASTSQATIVQFGLYDTGVDSAGTSLGGGVVDPHYTLASGGAVVVQGGAYPIPPWLDYSSPNGSSRWISIDSSGGGGTDACYTYATTFALPTTPASIVLSGRWAADNNAEMYLNVIDSSHKIGALLFQDAQGTSFSHYDSFSITSTSLFNAGQNTMFFVVHNGYVPPQSGSAGPFGLRVDNLSIDFVPVPEPTTLVAGALLLLPLGASTVRVLRKNRKA